jgi:hypothetical protein
MRIIVLGLMFAFFTATAVHARIGESFEQCVKRYGTPVTTNEKLFDQRSGLEMKQFIKDSVKVKVVFNEGKAVCMEYDYSTLKLETGEKSSKIIKQLLDVNGKDWKPDSTTNNRDWLLEINDDEGVIASDKIEPGFAKDRWICDGGPEKGGIIAVKSKISRLLIIVNSKYMELVMKNQPKYFQEREDKVRKALQSF